MRIQRPKPPFLTTLCFLFCFLLIGCASQGTSISQGASTTQPAHGSQTAGTIPSQSDRADPPILLRDPPPGQLGAYINLTIGGYERTTREQTTIGLSFASNGRLVSSTALVATVIELVNQVGGFPQHICHEGAMTWV